jgi:GGDEF domain-containing protein
MAWFSKDRGVPAVEAAAHEERLRRCIALLMEGVRLHTCNEDDAFAPPFNRLMRQLGTQLDTAQDDAEILGVITAAIDGMKNVRRESNALISQIREESKLLSRFLLTGLIDSLAAQKPETAGIIAALGPEFERAKTPEEIKALRVKLEGSYSPDAPRPGKSENGAGLQQKKWNEREIETETADSPTGLRGRVKAKEGIASEYSNRSSAFVVVFVLEGYGVIERQYGADAAQDCLIAASNYLLQSLDGSDALFHWDRNSLLGIVKREGKKQKDVGVEMLRICSASPQQSIRVGQRTVLAAMSIKPNVVATHEIEDQEELLKQANQFAFNGA